MTYLTDLAQEIVEADAYTAWRAHGDKMPSPDTPEACRATALLALEILQVGSLSAVVTSVFNAMERQCFVDLDQRAMRPFIPGHSDALMGAAAELLAHDGDMSLVVAIKSYLAQFNLAVRLTQALMAPTSAAPNTAGDDIELIADAWRRTCARTLDAEAMLAKGLRDTASARRTAERERARQLMEAAALGGWPCLDADGRVNVPGWAERRRSVRVAVSQLVTVIAHGVGVAGRLIDVSREGMQIEVASDSKIGDAIAVVLADQRRVRGHVRWARDGRIGVLLDHSFDF